MKRKTTSWQPLLLVALLGACSGPQATTTPTAVVTSVPVEATATSLPAAAPAAEMIFFNGNLITMDPTHPVAQAIALGDGIIQAVGSDDEILALQSPDTVLVDLHGHTLMPGFIDGHTHLLTFYGRMDRTFDEAQGIALANGYTMVSEMWANQDVVNAMLDAERSGTLRMRVNLFPSYNDGILDEQRNPVFLETWYPANGPILDPDRLVRIPGIKIFVDGDNASYERGCWAMTDPFPPSAGVLARGVCGTPSGDLYWEQDELNQVVRDAQDAGYRVAFHAMGDRAIETALNAVEAALDGRTNKIYRHQIDHNSMIRPDLLARYQYLGVAVTVRGHIDVCDLSFVEEGFGAERKEWYVNRFELANLGIHAFIETDFGWTEDPQQIYSQRTLNPFLHLYGYVTHRYASAEGTSCPPDPLLVDKGISMDRALQMLTIEPAWAVSMEDYVGSLSPGKFADLIILSEDPLSVDGDEIMDLSVLMTMVGGQVEYCADTSTLCPTDGDDTEFPEALPTGGNLALGQKVIASASLPTNPPSLITDGDLETNWIAGDFAPQWIEIDLGMPANVTEIRLRVSQTPDGNTTHRILVGNGTGSLEEIHLFQGNTVDGTWLTYAADVPLEDVRIVRIETETSRSWVSWFEIEVLGTRP